MNEEVMGEGNNIAVLFLTKEWRFFDQKKFISYDLVTALDPGTWNFGTAQFPVSSEIRESS